MALYLIRSQQPAHGELDLPVGKLAPTLDDFEMAALRNAPQNITDLETRRLQRQCECLESKVVIYSLSVAAIGEMARSFAERLCGRLRTQVHRSRLAQFRNRWHVSLPYIFRSTYRGPLS